MPYERNQDLPDAVRNKLRQHGQEIYRKAYNSAWDEYKDPDHRRVGRADDREEVAHKVAWAALDGLGEIEICLATFRPGLAVFTREDTALRNHQHAQTEIDVRLEVRIKPGEARHSTAAVVVMPPCLRNSCSQVRSSPPSFRQDSSML